MNDTRAMDVPTKLLPSVTGKERVAQADSHLRVLLLHNYESVEVVLDWLERSGRKKTDVLTIPDGFVVRWREE